MQSAPLGIRTASAGKRHGRQWVLRHWDLNIEPGTTWALLGANGSGKSSLLRLLCGFDRPTEGTVEWEMNGETMDPMEVPLALAYAAPDQSLLADLTVDEHLAFHFQIRAGMHGIEVDEARNLALLEDKGHVLVRELSSGMRQRLALTLVFVTDCQALFLDEPCSHLDQAGRDWYTALVQNWRKGRTLVVASNHDPGEYPGVDLQVDLSV